MAKKIKRGSRRGQGMTEYVLLVAVVVGILFMFKKRISDGIAKVTDSVFKGANTAATDLSSSGN